MSDVTRILSQIESGDPQAAEQLLPLVYNELRRLARLKLSQEKPGQTLQATALVHEAYLRLVGRAGAGSQEPGVSNENSADSHLATGHRSPAPTFNSRGHFFSAAAEAMRRILVDNARRRRRLKRGHSLERETFEEAAIAAPEVDGDLVELDAALDILAAKDPRAAELIKLRYFAGLTIQQAAQALGISVTTANRDWGYARAWLFRQMSQETKREEN